jgi:hypothetical protein
MVEADCVIVLFVLSFGGPFVVIREDGFWEAELGSRVLTRGLGEGLAVSLSRDNSCIKQRRNPLDLAVACT